jgi:hypothetical protein
MFDSWSDYAVRWGKRQLKFGIECGVREVDVVVLLSVAKRLGNLKIVVNGFSDQAAKRAKSGGKRR